MSSLPRVRGACEYCHHRKIRCIIPPNTSSCHNCAATGVICFFKPRLKSGRRPKSSTSQVLPEPDSGDSVVDSSSEHTDEGFEVSTYDTSSLPLDAQIFLPFNGPPWSEYATSGHLSISQSLSPPAMAPPRSGPTFAGDVVSTSAVDAAEPLNFEAALKLCADIDQRARLLRKAPSLDDAEAHVQALDAVCMASITIQSSTDSASRSMVLAGLYKALEICQLLFQTCVPGAVGSCHTALLRKLLLLRRLDIIVTFGKICFERMGNGHVAGVREAEEMHTSIERLLRLNYGSWA